MLFDPKMMRMAAMIANAMLTKAIILIAAFFLGRWLDQRFGTDPWLMFLCVLVGLAVGIWWIILLTRKL